MEGLGQVINTCQPGRRLSDIVGFRWAIHANEFDIYQRVFNNGEG